MVAIFAAGLVCLRGYGLLDCVSCVAAVRVALHRMVLR